MPVMGVDLGTGGVRAVVLDPDSGELIASATASIESHHPHPGWSQQAPQDWWRAACEAISKVITDGPMDGRDIQAVGLSGQMHGCTLIDAADQPLRPAILWNDQRTQPQCEVLLNHRSEQDWRRVQGKPPMTGLTLPSLLWVRENEPDVFANISGLLLPKDWIRLQLTGDRATDMGDASGTLLLDLERRRWDNALLEQLQLNPDVLPRLHEGPDITGEVTQAAAAQTRLRACTPVVAGGGDQQAGGIGCGICLPGRASLNLGTSGVVFAASDTCPQSPPRGLHAFCHSVPDQWHVMGVVLSAGGALRWWSDVTGCNYDELVAEAQGVESGAQGVMFKPYLTGERTPHENPALTGAFHGLRLSHERPHMTRAVFEGVAFALREALELVEDGTPLPSLRCTGGATQSPFWLQLIADTFQRQVTTINVHDGSALGAAVLASVAGQKAPALQQACERLIQDTEHVPPRHDDLTERFDRWRSLPA